MPQGRRGRARADNPRQKLFAQRKSRREETAGQADWRSKNYSCTAAAGDESRLIVFGAAWGLCRLKLIFKN
jgi:hypothetical protein